VGSLPCVFLYSMEDLQSVARRNKALRRGEIAKVEELIEKIIKDAAGILSELPKKYLNQKG